MKAYCLFPNAIAVELHTTKIAPMIPNIVKCSAAIKFGDNSDTNHDDNNVTRGVKANAALTPDASQCFNASAKAP